MMKQKKLNVGGKQRKKYFQPKELSKKKNRAANSKGEEWIDSEVPQERMQDKKDRYLVRGRIPTKQQSGN